MANIDFEKLKQALVLDMSEAKIDFEIPESKKFDIFEMNVSEHSHVYEIKAEKIDGEFLKVIYTGVNQSSYGKKPINKIEIIYSDLKSEYIRESKFLSIYHYNYAGEFTVDAEDITMSIRLYNDDNELIELTENTAYINAYNHSKIAAEILNDEDHKGIAIKNDWFNVSGDSINVKYTSSSPNYIMGWISTDLVPNGVDFDIKASDITLISDQYSDELDKEKGRFTTVFNALTSMLGFDNRKKDK